jgi:hypothetical protein
MVGEHARHADDYCCDQEDKAEDDDHDRLRCLILCLSTV